MAHGLQSGLRNGGLRRGGLHAGLGNGSIFNIASLDLNFAKYKNVGSLVTFTRASSGTFVGSDGLLMTAATNEPRFDHKPTTGESLGLLVEEQRTNLLTYSEDQSNAAWAKVGTTISSNSVTAPTGSITADTLVEDTSTGTHRSVCSATILSSTIYSISIFAKAAGRTHLRLNGGSGLAGEVIANLSNGTVASSSGATNPVVQNVGDGWYRISFTTAASTGTAGQVTAQLVQGTSTTSYIGDGISGVYIWGAQLEAGAFPTSYIPTTTAAATRSADVASNTGAAFSSWYRQDEGTVFLDAASYQSVAAANAGAVINDGTLNNRIEIDVRAGSLGGAGRLTVISGGAVSFDTGNSLTLAFAVNTFYRQGASYKLDSFAFSINGGVAQTDTSGGVPTAPDRIELGARLSTALPLNGTIRRLTYWPARLSNSTLQQITQ